MSSSVSDVIAKSSGSPPRLRHGAHTGTALHYLAAMLLRRAPHTARVVDLAGVVEAGVSALTRLELGLPRFHSLWSLARGPGHSGGAGAASSGSAGAWHYGD